MILLPTSHSSGIQFFKCQCHESFLITAPDYLSFLLNIAPVCHFLRRYLPSSVFTLFACTACGDFTRGLDPKDQPDHDLLVSRNHFMSLYFAEVHHLPGNLCLIPPGMNKIKGKLFFLLDISLSHDRHYMVVRTLG